MITEKCGIRVPEASKGAKSGTRFWKTGTLEEPPHTFVLRPHMQRIFITDHEVAAFHGHL